MSERSDVCSSSCGEIADYNSIQILEFEGHVWYNVSNYVCHPQGKFLKHLSLDTYYTALF